jgi:hypothetical protein
MSARRTAVARVFALLVMLLAVSPFTAPFAAVDVAIAGADKAPEGSDGAKTKLASHALTTNDVAGLAGSAASSPGNPLHHAALRTPAHDRGVPSRVLRI